MRAVIQRAARAQVTVDGEVIGAIGPGLCVLVGVAIGDGADEVTWLARRVAKLRIFADDQGKMNLSLLDLPTHGLLMISQFTLCADTSGHRPGFAPAAEPAVAEPLITALHAELGQLLARAIAGGRFGADMQVSLTNDGPVTICLDSTRR